MERSLLCGHEQRASGTCPNSGPMKQEWTPAQGSGVSPLARRRIWSAGALATDSLGNIYCGTGQGTC